MNFKIKKPNNGIKISIVLLITILLLIIIVNIVPNNDVKIEYGFKVDNGILPLWKILCYILIVILFIAEIIVTRIMCRCPKCQKYILMNIHTKYCPYCSTKIDE